jgi:hypothetical protein
MTDLWACAKGQKKGVPTIFGNCHESERFTCSPIVNTSMASGLKEDAALPANLWDTVVAMASPGTPKRKLFSYNKRTP